MQTRDLHIVHKVLLAFGLNAFFYGVLMYVNLPLESRTWSAIAGELFPILFSEYFIGSLAMLGWLFIAEWVHKGFERFFGEEILSKGGVWPNLMALAVCTLLVFLIHWGAVKIIFWSQTLLLDQPDMTIVAQSDYAYASLRFGQVIYIFMAMLVYYLLTLRRVTQRLNEVSVRAEQAQKKQLDYDAARLDAVKRYGFGMGQDKIYVYLNPEAGNPYGLHAFVDSRVTGPWGQALVEELIPHLLGKYRIRPDANQHFLVGQSSGGYGALWLQMHYPAAFGGCWAVSPDPIDFSDFLSVDLYAKGANAFFDSEKKERPFFWNKDRYHSTIRQFAQFEHFLGDGGQMQSFEAAYGLPDRRMRPRPLYDRSTGVIDPKTVNAWKSYDLGLYMQSKYTRLLPQLDGKIHVYAGAADNFYINRSVLRFKEKTKSLPGKITVEIIPEADHWSIWSATMTQLVQSQMDEKIKN
jgi:S-formylglutathione hydrolase FrmB